MIRMHAWRHLPNRCPSGSQSCCCRPVKWWGGLFGPWCAPGRTRIKSFQCSIGRPLPRQVPLVGVCCRRSITPCTAPGNAQDLQGRLGGATHFVCLRRQARAKPAGFVTFCTILPADTDPPKHLPDVFSFHLPFNQEEQLSTTSGGVKSQQLVLNHCKGMETLDEG